MKLIKEYYERGFDYLEEGDEMEIVKFIQENDQKAPVLYRGIHTDEELEEGDELFLQGDHMFVSMTPNEKDAWNFGNVIIIIDGLEGWHLEDSKMITEWIVEDRKVYIDKIEYDDNNDLTLCYCSF